MGTSSLNFIERLLLYAVPDVVAAEKKQRIDPLATIGAACAQLQPAPDLDTALAGMRALNAEVQG